MKAVAQLVVGIAFLYMWYAFATRRDTNAAAALCLVIVLLLLFAG